MRLRSKPTQRRWFGTLVLAGSLLVGTLVASGCTLITDIDRNRIDYEARDAAAPQAGSGGSGGSLDDAGAPDASADGSDAGAAVLDSGSPAGDTDAGSTDAGSDAGDGG